MTQNIKKDIRLVLAIFKKNQFVDDTLIRLMCRWRNKNISAFMDKTPTTFKKTKQWWASVVENPDKILFFVDYKEKYVGHGGLASFDYERASCELDNIVRGNKGGKGLMNKHCEFLIDLAFLLGVKIIELRVLPDNWHAIKFYIRLGFKPLYMQEGFLLMRYEK